MLFSQLAFQVITQLMTYELNKMSLKRFKIFQYLSCLVSFKKLSMLMTMTPSTSKGDLIWEEGPKIKS